MAHHYSPPWFIYQSPRYTIPPPKCQVPIGWKGDPMERHAHIRRVVWSSEDGCSISWPKPRYPPVRLRGPITQKTIILNPHFSCIVSVTYLLQTKQIHISCNECTLVFYQTILSTILQDSFIVRDHMITRPLLRSSNKNVLQHHQ